MYEFKLPDLGEGIHEGEILKWHVQPGDTIREDEPLVDVETDKATVTIPSPSSGRVVSVGAQVGQTVTVGRVLTVIDDGAGPTPDAGPTVAAESPTPAQPPSPVQTGPGKPAVTPAGAKSPPPAGGRAIAAPATRRLARELNIDINKVPPTGRAGRVTADDVRRFAVQGTPPVAESTAAPVPVTRTPPEESDVAGEGLRMGRELAATSPLGIPFFELEPLPDFAQWGPVETEPLRSIRRKVARKMTTSMLLVPHVAHMDEADVTLLEEFRAREREKREGQPGGRLTLLSFVIQAVTAGLRATPAFNASLDPFREQIIYKKYYNIGIAVDTGRGLVVPVIRDTDRKSILQVSAEIEEKAALAREDKLEVCDLRGGTFTITNVGPLGGTALIPTINYPEVAILGLGRIQEKPVVRDGRIVIRKMLPLTLAFDHRVADGADAARFVTELTRQLADPSLLLVET